MFRATSYRTVRGDLCLRKPSPVRANYGQLGKGIKPRLYFGFVKKLADFGGQLGPRAEGRGEGFCPTKTHLAKAKLALFGRHLYT